MIKTTISSSELINKFTITNSVISAKVEIKRNLMENTKGCSIYIFMDQGYEQGHSSIRAISPGELNVMLATLEVVKQNYESITRQYYDVEIES